MSRKTIRLCLTTFLFVFCFLAIPGFAASHRGFSSDALPVFSDFDGDNKLDQAELFSNGAQKSIHVSLGKFAWQSLSFDSGSEGRGHLVSDDIDRDGDADLVWVSQDFPTTFVMWLGDGRGNFRIARGHEHDRLQDILDRSDQTHFTENPDGRESTCVVQSTPQGASERNEYRSHEIRSEPRPIASQPPCISAVCFSVLLERGPPSQLS